MSTNQLPGNPYADEDAAYSEGNSGLVSATLALAFEQRTANLLAATELARASGTHINMDIALHIDARLGLGKYAPQSGAAPARTVHDEAQELHRIIGSILQSSQGVGQYDTLAAYEPDLERALELAAIYVADTE